MISARDGMDISAFPGAFRRPLEADSFQNVF
jgi:hypothetical protein